MKLNYLKTKTEHTNEHILQVTIIKKYRKAVIYDAKGDLSKRWYVYFYFRNPDTGKIEKIGNFYNKANFYKTRKERLEILRVTAEVINKELKNGYNPFEYFSDYIGNKIQNKRITIDEAFQFFL